MIHNVKKWNSLAIKKMSFSLWELTLKHNVDYYCINCLHPFRTENKLKTHENVCKNLDYCYIKMTEEGKIY